MQAVVARRLPYFVAVSLFVGVFAAIAVLFATSPPGDAEDIGSLAGTASISGTVRDELGQPVIGADVEVCQGGDLCEITGTTTTGIDGTYSLTGLAGGAGAWVTATPAPGSDLLPGRTQGFFLAASEARVGVDIVLATARPVSGTVTDEEGLPVEGVTVSTSDYWGPISTTTAADGSYTLLVGAGEYRIQFVAPSDRNLMDEYYDDAATVATATPVVVTTVPIVGIDAELSPGATITGTVTSPGSIPFAGTPIEVYQAGSSFFDHTLIRQLEAATDGSYTTRGLRPGNYIVRFRTPAGSSLVEEFWQGSIADVLGATQITLGSGATVSGIDAAMQEGGRIAGIVRDEAGLPIAGASVSAGASLIPGTPRSTTTGVDGSYELVGLAGGDYTVGFDSHGKLHQTAPATVSLGVTTSGVDVTLVEGGTIAGTVTDPLGAPVSGANVLAAGPRYVTATTGADGSFTVVGLETGSYTLRFSPPEGVDLVSEYWQDSPSVSSATPVAVTTGSATTGIDAVLDRPAVISGRVTDASGNPLSAFVSLSTGSSSFAAVTASDGTYQAVVPPGTFNVAFYPQPGSVFLAETYNDKPILTPGDPVVAVGGETTSGIDAVLEEASSISGTVRDSSGTPRSGVTVYADRPGSSSATASTDAMGNYQIVLPAGTYTVRFIPQFTTGLAAETYDDRPLGAAGTLIPIGPGEHVVGIDAELGPDAAIVGTITDAAGIGVVGAQVSLLDAATGEVVGQATADWEGAYAFIQLPSRSYKVRATPPFWYSHLRAEYYDDALSLQAATVIDLSGEFLYQADIQLDLPASGVPYDFTGDGRAQASVYRDGAWFVDGAATQWLGTSGDVPVPADYDGDGVTDRAVWRPSTGAWFVEGQATAYWGLATDIAVPGDYTGDGVVDRAVYRPSTGGWHIDGFGEIYLGLSGDVPVPADYDGNGVDDAAVWRPSTGAWFIDGREVEYFGLPGDVPVPADFDGDGADEIAVWRPATGAWFVLGELEPQYYGLSSDLPVPADFDGDGDADLAVWRDGTWLILGSDPVYYGQPSDIPLPIPPAIRQYAEGQ
jgi:hypothetical protein